MSKPIRINGSRVKTPQSINAKQTVPTIVRRQPSCPSPTDVARPLSEHSTSSTELFLTLPIPPSINHQYATVNGRRILSSTGRHYKTAVAQQILVTLTSSPHSHTLLTNLQSYSLILSVWFYFTSALRRDLDGGLKIAQDAICNAMEINDNRIGEIHLYRGIDKQSPRMECLLSIDRTAPLPPKKKKPVSLVKRLTGKPMARRAGKA